jgi:hypothetical protein
MLYLININWTRRQPEEGRPSKGRVTFPEQGRTLTTAKNKAVRKFNRHFGMHLAIDQVAEFQDPAGIFKS